MKDGISKLRTIHTMQYSDCPAIFCIRLSYVLLEENTIYACCMFWIEGQNKIASHGERIFVLRTGGNLRNIIIECNLLKGLSCSLSYGNYAYLLDHKTIQALASFPIKIYGECKHPQSEELLSFWFTVFEDYLGTESSVDYVPNKGCSLF